MIIVCLQAPPKNIIFEDVADYNSSCFISCNVVSRLLFHFSTCLWRVWILCKLGLKSNGFSLSCYIQLYIQIYPTGPKIIFFTDIVEYNVIPNIPMYAHMYTLYKYMPTVHKSIYVCKKSFYEYIHTYTTTYKHAYNYNTV